MYVQTIYLVSLKISNQIYSEIFQTNVKRTIQTIMHLQSKVQVIVQMLCIQNMSLDFEGQSWPMDGATHTQI